MEGKYWYQQPLRMLQTVLREPDIADYSAAEVFDNLRRTNSNCIIVNAGGIIDFFPNSLPMARENQFMQKENMLGSLVEECHKYGIRVMVRVDFRGVERDRYEQHPDWFAQDAKGNGVTGWNGQLYKPCYNGFYSNDHAVEYIRSMMSCYDIDGVWENSVGFGWGPCYCRRCREQYRNDTGKEIPVGDDYASDTFAEYRQWKAQCADAHLNRMRQAVKSFGEDKAYCAEIFGMFHVSSALYTGIDLYNAKDRFDFLVSPAFLDGTANPAQKYDNLWYAASSIRFLKSIAPEKQAVLLCGNNGTKWRYIKAPELETRIWLWEAASVGGGYWNCMFNGQQPAATVDTRNAYIEQDVYTYLEQNEPVLANQLPVQDVGIFYSKPTRDRFGDDAEQKDSYGVFIKGVESLLTERHIQYSFIPDLDFSLDKIRHLKALILPNSACLSDQQMDIIREYGRGGGGLIATYETSLYDEKGNRRNDFGLGDLFGLSFTGMRKDTSSDCYQQVRERHPILADMGIQNTRMIMNDGETLLCTQTADSTGTVICSYVPLIFNQPPEFAWIPQTRTEYPTIFANRYGSGRVVYFSNQTDKLCYTNGHEDFLQTLFSAIRWAANRPFTLETDAPESVHITLTENREDPSKKVLSLVNLTAGPARPLRRLTPVRDINITADFDAKEVKDYRVLKQDGQIQLDTEKKEGRLRIHIRLETLKEFTSISLNLSE